MRTLYIFEVKKTSVFICSLTSLHLVENNNIKIVCCQEGLAVARITRKEIFGPGSGSARREVGCNMAPSLVHDSGGLQT